MPTMITVPIGDRTKSIQFGAAYSPSMSFNPNNELLSGCSGVLSGMGITVNTVPNPDQVTVDAGAFIQRGIIVNVASAQIVEAPATPTFPLYLVAENANEVHNSTVSYLFTTTPAADSVIIAQWTAGPLTSPDTTPVRISLCGLRDAIGGVTSLIIQRERFVALAAQTIFTLPGAKAYTLGTNKLRVFRNGKKLEESFDYSEDSPTQFTLNVPSVAGDVIECIIYIGAPSISGLALLDLTDVTTNLANAIKDSSTVRVATADAANPLASIADIAAMIAAAAPPAPVLQRAIRTTNATPTTLAAPGVAAVTGLSLSVPMVIGKPVQIGFRGAISYAPGTPFQFGADIIIGGVRLSTTLGLTNYLIGWRHDSLNDLGNMGFTTWYVPTATGTFLVEAAIGADGGAGSMALLAPSELWVFRPQG